MATQTQTDKLERVMTRFYGAAFFVLLGIGAAHAQTPPDSSGPQTAVPAPLPRGQADVPGGSARNGVIQPPAVGGAMPVVKPPARGSMPVIRPPTATRSSRPVQPK